MLAQRDQAANTLRVWSAGGPREPYALYENRPAEYGF
jgi:hypothetical protein